MWSPVSASVLVLLFCRLSALAIQAQTPKPVETIPIEQIHAGMRGVAYTVFQGTKPEPMDVEVLGVLKNANGPKGDVILVRLGGDKGGIHRRGRRHEWQPRLSGWQAGGSARLPHRRVLERTDRWRYPDRRDAGDQRAGSKSGLSAVEATSAARSSSKTGARALQMRLQTRNLYQLSQTDRNTAVFNGFSEDTVQRFASQFSAAGIVPVMGAGSVSDAKQPEPLEPGSAVSAILVRGDMDIAATCTVTYMDAQHLLACGHPLMQFGMVDLPMTKATVLATLPSPLNAFKIVNATEAVGAFVQDRHNGIMGEFGRKPEMIPVTLTIRGESADKQFHYEVLNNARLSPVAMMATVFNALHGVNEYGEETTYRMNGSISVDGYPDVALQDMFAAADGGQPGAMLAAHLAGRALQPHLRQSLQCSRHSRRAT